jgi:hypothetical protein
MVFFFLTTLMNDVPDGPSEDGKMLFQGKYVDLLLKESQASDDSCSLQRSK